MINLLINCRIIFKWSSMKAIQLTRSNFIGLANGGKTTAQRLLKIPHAAKAKVSGKAIEFYLFETKHFSSAAKLFKHHWDSQPFRVSNPEKVKGLFLESFKQKYRS